MKFFAGSVLVVSLLLSLSRDSLQEVTNSTEDPEKCYRTIDLVFVIDGSNSLGLSVFNSAINTISLAVNVLTFGDLYARVGAVLYSNTVTGVVELTNSSTEFQEGIKKFEYPDEETNTHLGIEEAIQVLNRSTERENVPSVIMIITDGESSNKIEAQYLGLVARSKGIDLWAVAVGRKADMDELLQIVNDTVKAFKIESYEVLADRLNNLTRIVCIEAVTRPTFTIPTTTPTTTTTVNTGTEFDYNTTSTPLTVAPGTDSVTDICMNSLSIGGVGYALYPGDCTKVIQCYHNPLTNKTLAVVRQCPWGQFWDPSCLKCADSWKVDCPYDKCAMNACSSDSGSQTYPMDGVCGGYWSCEKGRSYPKCCPPCFNYQAGYGCKFGTACFDDCGTEEVCSGGIGVCEKIPDWNRSSLYSVASDNQGLTSTSCLLSELTIVGCSCRTQLMDFFRQDGRKCEPYAEYKTSLACSELNSSFPVKSKGEPGTFAIRIRMNLSSPWFQISSTPSSIQCHHSTHLTIWADTDGVHASLGNVTKDGVQTTVPFKNVTGNIEIWLSLHRALLTLAVRQDRVQFVSTVKAKQNQLCTDCLHDLAVTSQNAANCLVTQMEFYDCRPEVTTIYTDV